MTLLSIVQDVTNELGLLEPALAATSTDQLIKQIVALVNREGNFLARDYEWEAITKEATHTTLAAELQGAMTTVAGSDYHRMVNETMWNRTLNRPVPGPLSRGEYQHLKSANITGPYPEYTIFGQNLYFLPAPAAGETVAFHYISENWAETSGGTGISKMTADTDVTLLPEELLTLGALWRFNKAKGFDYSEDYRTYQQAVSHAKAKDGSKRSFDMGSTFKRRPGIIVPEGSWTP